MTAARFYASFNLRRNHHLSPLVSGALIDDVTVQPEVEDAVAPKKGKQMINLASHMAPASGII